MNNSMSNLMPPTPKSFRAACIAFAFLALPVFAQEPPAAPATETPAADAADAAAATDATIAAPAEGTDLSSATEPPADTRALDETVQDLKKDVVDLNKELFVLEEELLFPANTQVA